MERGQRFAKMFIDSISELDFYGFYGYFAGGILLGGIFCMLVWSVINPEVCEFFLFLPYF